MLYSYVIFFYYVKDIIIKLYNTFVVDLHLKFKLLLNSMKLIKILNPILKSYLSSTKKFHI